MKKKLAIVVHGIGEQNPGDTLDMLVGGLTGGKAVKVQSEERKLQETEFTIDRQKPIRRLPLFPCQIRRVEVVGNGDAPKQVVFAEAFWGDISRGKGGQVRGLLEMFQLIMGLGHIVRENAAEIHPEPSLMRKAANLFVVLLHGPLSALNIVFAVGVFVLFLAQWASAGTSWAPYAPSITMLSVAVLLLLAQRLMRPYLHSQLLYVFWQWLPITAGFLAGLVFITHVVVMKLPDSQQYFLTTLFQWQCLLPPGSFNACLDYWYTAALLFLIGIIWGMAILLVAFLGLVQFILDRKGSPNAAKTLYPATCALMLILWMFLAIVVWVAAAHSLAGLLDRAGIEGANLNVLERSLPKGLSLSLWVWGAFVTLLVFVAMVLVQRIKAVKSATLTSVADNPVPRLVVHPLVRIGLTLGVLILMAGAAMVASRQAGTALDTIPAIRTTIWEDTLFRISLSAALGIAVLYSLVRNELTIGIGIAKDIVVYFVRKPFGSKQIGPDYPLRARIQDRFDTTFLQLLAAEQPDELIVISHSQGTLIALEALRDDRMKQKVEAAGMAYPKVDLITMGSPTDHLYSFYFPSDFGLNENLRNGINNWVNIFRLDDFVGTTVHGPAPDFPKNIAVNAFGHTAYWLDEEVLPHLRENGLQEFT